MSNETKPVAWTARSWLASKSGGHFVQDRRHAFDVPLYDQSALDAAVAAERERCAKLCEIESVTLATRDQTRGALYCAQQIRGATP